MLPGGTHGTQPATARRLHALHATGLSRPGVPAGGRLPRRGPGQPQVRRDVAARRGRVRLLRRAHVLRDQRVDHLPRAPPRPGRFPQGSALPAQAAGAHLPDLLDRVHAARRPQGVLGPPRDRRLPDQRPVLQRRQVSDHRGLLDPHLRDDLLRHLRRVPRQAESGRRGVRRVVRAAGAESSLRLLPLRPNASRSTCSTCCSCSGC